MSAIESISACTQCRCKRSASEVLIRSGQRDGTTAGEWMIGLPVRSNWVSGVTSCGRMRPMALPHLLVGPCTVQSPEAATFTSICESMLKLRSA